MTDPVNEDVAVVRKALDVRQVDDPEWRSPALAALDRLQARLQADKEAGDGLLDLIPLPWSDEIASRVARWREATDR